MLSASANNEKMKLKNVEHNSTKRMHIYDLKNNCKHLFVLDVEQSIPRKKTAFKEKIKIVLSWWIYDQLKIVKNS